MRIEYSKRFLKRLKKSPSLIKKQLVKRVRQFGKNKDLRILNNHALKGKWRGYRSINITGDWRVIYREIDNSLARFYLIGTHSQLYG